MAHNSKRNRRHTTAQDGDDYVYPTKKVRETKTRNRKRDAALIKAGLVEHVNTEIVDNFTEHDIDDDAQYLEALDEIYGSYN